MNARTPSQLLQPAAALDRNPLHPPVTSPHLGRNDRNDRLPGPVRSLPARRRAIQGRTFRAGEIEPITTAEADAFHLHNPTLKSVTLKRPNQGFRRAAQQELQHPQSPQAPDLQ